VYKGDNSTEQDRQGQKYGAYADQVLSIETLTIYTVTKHQLVILQNTQRNDSIHNFIYISRKVKIIK